MNSAPLPPKCGDRPAAQHQSIVNSLRVQVGQDIGIVPTTPALGKSVALRKKTRLLFGMALTGLMGVLYAASSTILIDSLKQAEAQHTRQAVAGVASVFSQTEKDFSTRLADWSAWDDTCTFIQDANKDYIKSNLVPESLEVLKINLALYIQPSGKIVFGTGFDRIHQKYTAIPQALRSQLSPQSLLLRHPNTKSTLEGIVLLPEGPMMISSRPIVTSEGKGPIRGTVIFGRLFDAAEIARMSKMVRLPLTIHGLNKPMPADFQAVRHQLSPSNPILVRPLSDKTIAGYALMLDIYGKPAVLLRVDVPRDIYHQGKKSLQYLVVALLIASLIFTVVTLPLLERLIVFWHERQEKEQRYRAVVTQASEGIFLIDADSKRFLESNAAFQNLLGYTAQEVLELTLYDAIAASPTSINADVQHIYTQKNHFTGEWQCLCKNNSLVDVEVSANLISYEERDALCIVVRDITQRKQAEQALRESEKRLS